MYTLGRRLEGHVGCTLERGTQQLEGGVEEVDPWYFFLWPQYNFVEEFLRN
jgi:hypothetical protein